jgi:hypothetical protein
MRDVCESELHAQRAFGIPAAEALLGLLADIDAADNLQVLPKNRIKDAANGECGAYEVLLPDDYVVRLSVSQYASHHNDAGGVTRSKVRRVMILSVERIEVRHG